MQLVTLDFETYFDDEYSLKKMTTEEYVRDHRFGVHCVCAKIDSGDTFASTKEIKSLYIENSGVLCHHAHFDGLILSHHYGIKPTFWFDTLSMARLVLPHLKSHSLESLASYYGLGTKTVPYQLFKGKRELDNNTMLQLSDGCLNDVELTYEIFKRLLPYVPEEELRVIDLTIRLFTEPKLRLDRESMIAYYHEELRRKKELLTKHGIEEKDLASNIKFAALLQSYGVEPPKKISLKTGKEAFAFAKTDDGFKELLTSDNDDIAALAECRISVKSNIAESRSKRMLDMDARGAMCVYLKAYGAHTLRWSGGDSMNWQNLKKKTPLRESLIASTGYVCVVVDKSQIECRLLNYMAGQMDVLAAFASGRDQYCDSATKFYGYTVTKKEHEHNERKLFKEVELGSGFGMGHVKFQTYIKQKANRVVSIEEAKSIINFYRRTHPRVTALWKEAEQVIGFLASGSNYTWKMVEVRDGRIYLPNGSYLSYEGLYKDEERDWRYPTKKGNSKLYGALLVENVVQALARMMFARDVLKIAEKYKVVMLTHDECVYIAREQEAQQAYDFGVEALTTNYEWCKDIPLAAEGGFARNYSK